MEWDPSFPQRVWRLPRFTSAFSFACVDTALGFGEQGRCKDP